MHILRPRLASRQCRHCRAPFKPQRPKHVYCSRCYRLGRAGAHLELAAQLYAADRRGYR
jgi:hypothetical protein